MVMPTATAEPEVTQRPRNLPPPIEGEDEIDVELVVRVRDGSMELEDEDHLIREIINVYRAHRAQGDLVWWKPPVVEGPTTFGEEYQIGYEVKFHAESGRPVGFDLMASQDHGEPIFTKRIPRRTWPADIYACPLSPVSEKGMEYKDLGFQTCIPDGFVNFAQWEDHVLRRHQPLIKSIEAVSEEEVKPVKQMWADCRAEASVRLAQRRESDPRLAKQGVSPTI